jgi:hypothetical protein
MTSREQLLANTFVSLADTLVADFDVIDFLHTLATRSVELLDADAAGIMLADPQLQGLGFHSAQALPMCLRDETIGALNLFRLKPGRLTKADLSIGQAMADVATVGLIQERAIAASAQPHT